MTIKISKAGSGDIPALESIALAQNSHKEFDYFGRCLQEQEEGRRVVLIASLNGEPAGYGMLNRRPQYALYKRLDIPEIQDLNVAPAFRKQGIGAALVARCEDVAREQGREYIGISVGLYSDYGAAQRLYVRLGYVPDGNGVTYDREPVRAGELRPVDDNLCLMMVKALM